MQISHNSKTYSIFIFITGKGVCLFVFLQVTTYFMKMKLFVICPSLNKHSLTVCGSAEKNWYPRKETSYCPQCSNTSLSAFHENPAKCQSAAKAFSIITFILYHRILRRFKGENIVKLIILLIKQSPFVNETGLLWQYVAVRHTVLIRTFEGHLSDQCHAGALLSTITSVPTLHM